jgi:hypothetical protein
MAQYVCIEYKIKPEIDLDEVKSILPNSSVQSLPIVHCVSAKWRIHKAAYHHGRAPQRQVTSDLTELRPVLIVALNER